jgi:long-chain acyl-CoA synthetase
VRGISNSWEARASLLGAIVLLRGDYSPRAVSLLPALIELKIIVAPLPSTMVKTAWVVDIVNPAFLIDSVEPDRVAISRRAQSQTHELVRRLQKGARPGLILFTSSSTGEPKGAVHDFGRLLQEFRSAGRARERSIFCCSIIGWTEQAAARPRQQQRGCIAGEPNAGGHLSAARGSGGGAAARLADVPEHVVPQQGIRRAASRRATSYLWFGTMPHSTLTCVQAAFPNMKLRQTCGLVELGLVRAKSLSSDPVGEGWSRGIRPSSGRNPAQPSRFRNARLPERAESILRTTAILLAADRVELNGDYIRFLARDSELINVGGQKVFLWRSRHATGVRHGRRRRCVR